MAQTLSQILLHLVSSTKNREPWICPAIRLKLHANLAGAVRALDAEGYRVGGVADHVHIACTLPRTMPASKLLEEIKKSSSMWIKQQTPTCSGFAWQSGYGAFSLGQSQLDALIAYIDAQEEHHRKRTFQEEYVEFLKRYGVKFDERFLWD